MAEVDPQIPDQHCCISEIVRVVPRTVPSICSNLWAERTYSITSSARASSAGGTVTPSSCYRCLKTLIIAMNNNQSAAMTATATPRTVTHSITSSRLILRAVAGLKSTGQPSSRYSIFFQLVVNGFARCPCPRGHRPDKKTLACVSSRRSPLFHGRDGNPEHTKKTDGAMASCYGVTTVGQSLPFAAGSFNERQNGAQCRFAT